MAAGVGAVAVARSAEIAISRVGPLEIARLAADMRGRVAAEAAVPPPLPCARGFPPPPPCPPPGPARTKLAGNSARAAPARRPDEKTGAPGLREFGSWRFSFARSGFVPQPNDWARAGLRGRPGPADRRPSAIWVLGAEVMDRNGVGMRFIHAEPIPPPAEPRHGGDEPRRMPHRAWSPSCSSLHGRQIGRGRASSSSPSPPARLKPGPTGRTPMSGPPPPRPPPHRTRACARRPCASTTVMR